MSTKGRTRRRRVQRSFRKVHGTAPNFHWRNYVHLAEQTIQDALNRGEELLVPREAAVHLVAKRMADGMAVFWDLTKSRTAAVPKYLGNPFVDELVDLKLPDPSADPLFKKLCDGR